MQDDMRELQAVMEEQVSHLEQEYQTLFSQKSSKYDSLKSKLK